MLNRDPSAPDSRMGRLSGSVCPSRLTSFGVADHPLSPNGSIGWSANEGQTGWEVDVWGRERGEEEKEGRGGLWG